MHKSCKGHLMNKCQAHLYARSHPGRMRSRESMCSLVSLSRQDINVSESREGSQVYGTHMHHFLPDGSGISSDVYAAGISHFTFGGPGSCE